MKKRFNDFLNEDTNKKFQYSIDKNQLENFELELDEKASDMGVDFNMGKTTGVSQIKIFLSLNGDEQSILELIAWIENNY